MKPSGVQVSEGRRPAPSRIRGVDVARALAISGMFAVHIGPTEAEGLAGRLYALSHGRAAILFLLVAGVGVSLLAGSRTTSTAEARLKLAWRALLLLPAGLALQPLDHGVFVILQDYAVLFVLGILVLGLDDRWLLGLAAAFGALGPLAYRWGELNFPEAFVRENVAITDPSGEIVHGLLLSGPYPFITWAAPFLLGMWIGRRDLRDPRVRVRLVLWGGGAAIVAVVQSAGLMELLGVPGAAGGWERLLVQHPHSQMPFWLLGSTGVAVCVLGVSLMAVDATGRLLWPLVASGQLALTIYVGHLVALHVWHAELTSEAVGEAAALVVGFTVAGALFATAWRAALRRGPLEVLLQPPMGRRRPDAATGAGSPSAGR